LAVAVGLNEAIVLQQVHYWLRNAEANRRHDNYQDGRWWVYNSYPEWKRDAFPWWSEDTIQRVFKSLEKKQLLITGKLSNNPYDQRKWYSIDYDALDNLNLRSSITATCVDALPQNAPMDDSKMRSSHHRKMRSSITENKTTTETTDREVAATAAPPPPSEPVPFEAIQAAPPEARKPNPQQAEVGAWSAVMELDIHIPANAKRVGNMLTGLRKSKDCQPTADVATWRFGRTPPPDGSWNFYTHTWQGAKGQPPTEREINAYWGAWLRPALKVMPNGSDQPRAAPPSRTERNRQLLEEAMRDATGQPPISGPVIEGRVIHGRAS
jgi:hypothetical protein